MFSIVIIVISVSNVRSPKNCIINCQNGNNCQNCKACKIVKQNFKKWQKMLKLSKIVKIKIVKIFKYYQNCQKIKIVWNCQNVDQVMFPHHSDQMSQRSQVSRVALWRCSLNVFVFVFVFVVVFVFSRWTPVLSSFRRWMKCWLECWNHQNTDVLLIVDLMAGEGGEEGEKKE